MSVVTAAGERLLTVEEYVLLPDNGKPSELVRGRIVTMNPPYPWHGFVCGRVDRIIGGFIETNDIGYALINDSGVVTERDPDTLRGANFLYYSYDKVPKGTLAKKGYLPVAPDLVVEVRSASDRWSEVLEKVAEYLKAGARVVGVVDPPRFSVVVYRADQPEVTFGEDDVLTLPDVLPNFSVPVRRFFET